MLHPSWEPVLADWDSVCTHSHKCPQRTQSTAGLVRLSCLTKQGTGLGCVSVGQQQILRWETPAYNLGRVSSLLAPQGRPCSAPLMIQGTYHSPLSSRLASPGSGAGFGKGPHGRWSPGPHPGCPREDLGAGREMLREGCVELSLAARDGPGGKTPQAPLP